MAKPNYSFEKRQRELAKKKKKEEKALRKQQQPKDAPADEARAPQPAEGEPSGEEQEAADGDSGGDARA